MERRKELIVGLGNPGKRYLLTRHNLGQRVIYAFAEKHHFSFNKEREIKGAIAQGIWEDKTLFLLFPMTYMNLSGSAVYRTIEYYGIAVASTLVISDDIALPFGECRFKNRGSSGGHKGLKSIETSLQTQDYPRLKLGVGEPLVGFLEDYVLAPFTQEEQEKLPEIIAHGVSFLEEWLSREI